MDFEPSISQLIQQCTTGDEGAARVMFERYSRRLIALAEKQLSQRLSSRVDGEDVVQSAFRSFFARSARGEFQIDGSVGLWNLLVTITLNKARSQARLHTADLRDVRAEESVRDSAWIVQVLHQEPGPAEAVALVDLVEQLLSGLPEEYAGILSRRLDGQSRAKIARELDISRRSITRALELLQQRLCRLLDPDDLPDREDRA